jgi:DnaJ-domain-containing protein 1
MEVNEPRRRAPWAILGVDLGATDEQVRAAYIEKVRQHPPDRDQEQFEQVRDAYEELRDPQRRAKQMFISIDPYQELPSLLGDPPVRRRHVGPALWLAVMKR